MNVFTLTICLWGREISIPSFSRWLTKEWGDLFHIPEQTSWVVICNMSTVNTIYFMPLYLHTNLWLLFKYSIRTGWGRKYSSSGNWDTPDCNQASAAAICWAISEPRSELKFMYIENFQELFIYHLKRWKQEKSCFCKQKSDPKVNFLVLKQIIFPR